MNKKEIHGLLWDAYSKVDDAHDIWKKLFWELDGGMMEELDDSKHAHIQSKFQELCNDLDEIRMANGE